MSKKEENNQPEENHLDINLYGYKEGEKAPFEGNMVLSLYAFLDMIAREETKETYELKDSFEKSAKTMKQLISPKGLQAIRFIDSILEGHTENVKEGVATHQDVLMGKVEENKPTFKKV